MHQPARRASGIPLHHRMSPHDARDGSRSGRPAAVIDGSPSSDRSGVLRGCRLPRMLMCAWSWFLGAETNQWHPDLMYGNYPIGHPGLPDDGYHFADVTDTIRATPRLRTRLLRPRLGRQSFLARRGHRDQRTQLAAATPTRSARPGRPGRPSDSPAAPSRTMTNRLGQVQADGSGSSLPRRGSGPRWRPRLARRPVSKPGVRSAWPVPRWRARRLPRPGRPSGIRSCGAGRIGTACRR